MRMGSPVLEHSPPGRVTGDVNNVVPVAVRGQEREHGIDHRGPAEGRAAGVVDAEEFCTLGRRLGGGADPVPAVGESPGQAVVLQDALLVLIMLAGQPQIRA